MTSLLIYYSRTGFTKKAAEEIARLLNCQSEVIEDTKSRQGILGYLSSGREAVFKKIPLIKELKHNPAEYDLVIIGTPNWAGNMASPVRAYLTHNQGKFKKIALVIVQGGSGAEKVKKNIEELTGLTLSASLVLMAKEVAAGQTADKINRFVGEIKKLT